MQWKANDVPAFLKILENAHKISASRLIKGAERLFLFNRVLLAF